MLTISRERLEQILESAQELFEDGVSDIVAGHNPQCLQDAFWGAPEEDRDLGTLVARLRGITQCIVFEDVAGDTITVRWPELTEEGTTLVRETCFRRSSLEDPEGTGE